MESMVLKANDISIHRFNSICKDMASASDNWGKSVII